MPVEPDGGWQPILEGDSASSALESARSIAAHLQDTAPELLFGGSTEADRPVETASLVRGRAGLAVFLGFLAQAQPRRGYDKLAADFLEQAISAVATLPMPAGLFTGFPGIAFALTLLQGSDVAEDPCEGMDAALRAYLERSPWRGEYDLVGGLVGLGVYALERLPRPDATACLEAIVARLDEVSERSPEGVTWFTPPERLPPNSRSEYARGFYNLGVAHGVPGVIAFLARVCQVGISVDRTRPMLDGALRWLASQRLPEGAGGRFATLAGPGIEREPARSAWCYGDPGVAAAILCAARCLGESEWEREGLDIARGAARRPTEEAGIQDACLCHGAVGLGHLFHRMHRSTGDPSLAEASRYWLLKGLDMREPGQGIAGYRTWKGASGPGAGWIIQPGLLDGAAGIGLGLLAAASPVEPTWDRMLLVSAPAGPR